MKFKHIIGKSTFKEGFTVPKSVYPFLALPQKGSKRIIQLLYGENQTVNAKLYHIANAVGHLQVRYGSQEGAIFRNWLTETFSTTSRNPEANLNEFIEITILEDSLFRIEAFPLSRNDTLYFGDLCINQLDRNELFGNERFLEIIEAVRSIQFLKEERQIYYNQELKTRLTERNWLSEQPVVNDKQIGLKCDFRKDDFQLEIEFGNARTYYQDIIKFAMAYQANIIKVGGLLVPSAPFAKHLCHLGHKNALQKSNDSKSSYSGMMDFNKAAREFEYIRNIFDIPFFILSINY